MSSYSFHGRTRIWTPRGEEENRAIFSTMPKDTGIKMPPEFKPVYLENSEYAVEKWSLKQLIRLLRLYGSHRCLWDARDPDNKTRIHRKAALVDITAAMGGEMTMDQVLQKINVLRGTYRYEKRRIKKRIDKGLGASTKLKWFALADAFLRNTPRSDKLKKTSENVVDSDSDLDDTVVFPLDPEVLNPLADREQNPRSSAEDRTNSSSSEESATVDDPIAVDQPENPVPFTFSTSFQPSQKQLKRPWTSIESVQFVQLLREQPILWQTNSSTDIEYELDYQSAIQEIASNMNLPLERILCRVRIFQLAYTKEKRKAINDRNYKSNLVWFALADTFMTSPKSLQSSAFVDPVPENIGIKTERKTFPEKMSEEDKSRKDSSIVVPQHSSLLAGGIVPSPRDDAELDVFKTTTGSSSSMQCHTTPSSLKLVLNGLEDDLLEGKWSLKHSVRFLRLYGSHRCLWDLSDADYRSRDSRNAAIDDIAAAMGYGLSAEYVAKKIKIFRITYMQHRKRMLEAYKDDKIQQESSQLRWFPLADSFLRPHIGLRSIKQHEREMPQYDFHYVYANLNLIDPRLLNDFVGKGTQNFIDIGDKTTNEIS